MVREDYRFQFNPNKDFYSVREIAQITGRTMQTVYNWIRDGKLRATKPGNWLIRRVDFLRFLKRYEDEYADVIERIEER